MKLFYAMSLIAALVISAPTFSFASEQEIQEFTSAQPPEGYPLVKGVVRRIDLAQGSVMIKHEAIPNLDMGPMTMTFKASDASILEGLKSGDKIRFAADDKDGELVVLWIEKTN